MEWDEQSPPPLVLDTLNLSECSVGIHKLNATDGEVGGVSSIEDLKYITYGLVWPVICVVGIVGNLMNLVVLSQPNMKGTAYIYMRGYSSAALGALVVAIPFAVRVLAHNENGPWDIAPKAFFHVYLELFLGNACLGMGVMMLVALTLERYVAVCQPEKARALQGAGKARVVVASIPCLTLLAHCPHLLRSKLVSCRTTLGTIAWVGKENGAFVGTIWYIAYRWFIGIVFRLGPTVLLAFLNLRIIIAYRATCQKRRAMQGKRTSDERRKVAEEGRIMLLLGSTSVLFFVCVTPMVLLSLTFSKPLLKSFPFQIFRSAANVLELTNYSLTFYIYCLFSREFRHTTQSLFSSKGKTSLTSPPPTKPSAEATNAPQATPQPGSTPLL